MKQARSRAINAPIREGAFRTRMRKFIKRLKRGEIPRLPARQDSDCVHEWALDGQTLQSVRWTCRICGESQFG